MCLKIVRPPACTSICHVGVEFKCGTVAHLVLCNMSECSKICCPPGKEKTGVAGMILLASQV